MPAPGKLFWLSIDIVLSRTLVFILIEYLWPTSSLKLLYLVAPGTLKGYNGIYPLDGIFYIIKNILIWITT